MQIKDLKEQYPLVYEAALINQDIQGNKKNDSLLLSNRAWKGNFNWEPSSEGIDFWTAIDDHDFDEAKEICPHLFEEKSLVGRYVKALVDNPQSTTFKKGTYVKIVKKLNDNQYKLEEEWFYIIHKDASSHWQLMPEGFNPDNIEEEPLVFGLYNIGDIVVNLEDVFYSNRKVGDLFKILPNSCRTVLCYKKGVSNNPKQWRLATPEEIQAYEKGITNINDMYLMKELKYEVPEYVEYISTKYKGKIVKVEDWRCGSYCKIILPDGTKEQPFKHLLIESTKEAFDAQNKEETSVLTEFPSEGCVYDDKEKLKVLAKYLLNRPNNKPDKKVEINEAIGIGWNRTSCWWLKTKASEKPLFEFNQLSDYLPKVTETPEFIAGKWYTNGVSFGKLSGPVSKNNFPCKEFIHDNKYRTDGTYFINFDNAILVEDLSEIQKYLPEGHPDKFNSRLNTLDEWLIKTKSLNLNLFELECAIGGIFSSHYADIFVRLEGTSTKHKAKTLYDKWNKESKNLDEVEKNYQGIYSQMENPRKTSILTSEDYTHMLNMEKLKKKKNYEKDLKIISTSFQFKKKIKKSILSI